jgi:lysophospholipase L1-like esterase
MARVTRRAFIGIAGAAAGASLLPDVAEAEAGPKLRRGSVILFQGDSITDNWRNKENKQPNQNVSLGTGYPFLVASEVLAKHPDLDLRFYNRGISGNKVPDLQARWTEDTIALKPDLLSILIGVNDIWHKMRGNYTGTVADYESQFTALLEKTRTDLPEVRLVVLEPFVLRAGVIQSNWFPEFDERRAAARRVAQRADAQWVPLQKKFDELAARNSPQYYAADGVHPTPAGHAVIAEQWRKIVGV